jgi:hypothetical protein
MLVGPVGASEILPDDLVAYFLPAMQAEVAHVATID